MCLSTQSAMGHGRGSREGRGHGSRGGMVSTISGDMSALLHALNLMRPLRPYSLGGGTCVMG